MEALWIDACTKFQREHNCTLPRYVEQVSRTGNVDIEEILSQAETDLNDFRKDSKLRSSLKSFASVVGSISSVLAHSAKLVRKFGSERSLLIRPTDISTSGGSRCCYCGYFEGL